MHSSLALVKIIWENLLEFFLNNTNLTFLAFLYKIDITGFQNQQKKIASTGFWTHNSHPTIKIPTALPTQPIWQSMPVSNFQTLIKSCSIEPEMTQVQFKDILFNKCLGGWVVKAVRILIVGLVLWVQNPSGGNFFLLILKPCDVNFVQDCQKCQICVI